MAAPAPVQHLRRPDSAHPHRPPVTGSASVVATRTGRAQSFILAAFAVLIAAGCVFRFWKLGGTGFWYDELWYVVGASDRSFAEMWREWVIGDPHPPGYFLFCFVWFKIFPNTEF